MIRNRAINKYYDLFIHFYVKNKKEKNREKKFLGKVTCLFLYDITGGVGVFLHTFSPTNTINQQVTTHSILYYTYNINTPSTIRLYQSTITFGHQNYS